MALLCAVCGARVAAGVTTGKAPVQVAASTLMHDQIGLQATYLLRE
jgi:hypothetical protein